MYSSMKGKETVQQRKQIMNEFRPPLHPHIQLTNLQHLALKQGHRAVGNSPHSSFPCLVTSKEIAEVTEREREKK